MRRMAGYPRWFFACLSLVCIALLATGILLLPHMLEMRLDIDAPVHIGGDLRLASAAAHATAGFLVTGLAGALLALHVRIGWRRRRNRISGLALLVLLATLPLTAVGIYYFGEEVYSLGSSAVHALAGLLAAVVYVWHAVSGARLRRAPSERTLT